MGEAARFATRRGRILAPHNRGRETVVTREADPRTGRNSTAPRTSRATRRRRRPRNLPGPKLTKAPDLVVFEKVSEAGKCSECGEALERGDFVLMEKGQPLCLGCGDLDHLVYLPAGDAAMSRRARKHSSLAAVVVRYSRARKRYERQGLLVTEEGLARAEQECAADAPARAAARATTAAARQDEDREFVAALTGAILKRYPGCPRMRRARSRNTRGNAGAGEWDDQPPPKPWTTRR